MMKLPVNSYYQLGLEKRQQLLAGAGFARDAHGIWLHGSGRAIGESVAAALTDTALLRYLGIDPASIFQHPDGRDRKKRAKPRKPKNKS